MVKKWQTPSILAVDGLPKTLGDCLDGSTDGITTGGEYCGCHDGQSTIGNSTGISMCNASVPESYGHGCSSGGVPSTCFCGLNASFPNH